MEEYRIGIMTLQCITWWASRIMDTGKHTLSYGVHTRNTFGIEFMVDKKCKCRILGFRAAGERICVLRVKEKFFNIIFICKDSPTNETEDCDKVMFYGSLEKGFASSGAELQGFA